MESPPIHVIFVTGETFETMWAKSIPHRCGGSDLRVPPIAHLIALKNRPERLARDKREIIHLLDLNPGVLSKDELRQLCTHCAPAESIRHLEVLNLL